MYSDFKKKLNLYRRYHYWKNQRAIFIHVPKVAGTSINKALYGRTLGHYTALEIKTKFPTLYKDSFVFSFVRNPWSRVVSAYKFAKKGRTESMGVRNPKQYQIPEFETFERFVKEWLVLQDVNKLDYIFQPQVLFLTDRNGDVITDYVEKLENLADGVVEIEKYLGRKIKIGRANATSSTDDYRNYYNNKELIGLVGNIYADDIKKFGYEF
ncbi:sulfotransferase family 2 domain-containing protein [uncultured Pseudoalteromonas sp.]|uniref:sulfotransferase family 2 domain-containing protein n=1 Tax=uncultured Pseudoalteromonas sp. TaxID=114053 RepID=UPI0025927BEC|nr:sulfotransferase family 2 domain-containing protein [uncultured Pseudoalteromonas sp.]